MLSRQEKQAWASVGMALLGFLIVFAMIAYASLASESGPVFTALAVAAGVTEAAALALGLAARALLPGKIGIGSALIMLVVLGIMLLIRAILPSP